MLKKTILKSTGEQVFEIPQYTGSLHSIPSSLHGTHVDVVVPREGMKHKKGVTLRVRKEKLATL